jgi:hypothetical protein
MQKITDNEERAWQLSGIWHSRVESRLAVLSILAAAVALLNGITGGKPVGTDILWASFGFGILSVGAYWHTLQRVEQALKDIEVGVKQRASFRAVRQGLGLDYAQVVLTALNAGVEWKNWAGLLSFVAYILLLGGFALRFFA